MVAEWESFLKVLLWTSEYQSVNNLFRYLKNRKTGSEASRTIYGYCINAFCKFADRLPDELVVMSKRDIETLVEDFGYHKKESGCNARTVNTLLCNLKTFFKVNGFKNDKELDVELFYQPVRNRTRKEYEPNPLEVMKMADSAKSLRDRAIILILASSGLRNSTLRALRYGDIKEELEKGETHIMIRVHTRMKELVSSACKGNLEYVTFISEEATDALRLYVADLLRRAGQLDEQAALFSSEYNQLPRESRIGKPLSDRQLQTMIKQAAQRAGIKDWKAVTPHCLRKTFESFLRSRLKDGTRLDIQTQTYLMGHILPGSADAYYNKNNVEGLRKEYSRIIFSPNTMKLCKAIEALKGISRFLEIWTPDLSSHGKKDAENIDLSRISTILQNLIDEIERDGHF